MYFINRINNIIIYFIDIINKIVFEVNTMFYRINEM